jgi:DNA-binding IclR family transcriptional regulator
VPVHSTKGEVVAAINVSTQANRMDASQIQLTIRDALQKAAQGLAPMLLG